MTEASHGPWYYQQVALGFNYRMTELQAALGLSQLDRLAQFVQERIRLTGLYQQLLQGLPLELPAPAVDGISSWHLYIIRLHDTTTRLRVFEALRASGIGVNVHYIPVHTQPDYQQLGFKPGDFPRAERYYEEAISLPIYPDLDEAQQTWVVECLRRALS